MCPRLSQTCFQYTGAFELPIPIPNWTVPRLEEFLALPEIRDMMDGLTPEYFQETGEDWSDTDPDPDDSWDFTHSSSLEYEDNEDT